jgi:phosphoribosyl-ATP pyrophosphohydrolase/phosphoribosyl-AMP cyclohydrolase
VSVLVLRLGEKDIEDFVQRVDFEKSQGFVPVIVQDAATNKVLMHAFMNDAALRLTLASGRMHFWSRTRSRLWQKGEESGHHSLLQNVILDCDHDAIVCLVQQTGAICHTGSETCFHNPLIPVKEEQIADAMILERIFEVVLDRIENPTKRSYVSQLTGKGEDAILRKIGEEATELILATKDDLPKEVIHEATDILFHILVLFAKKGIKLQKIFEELEIRHKLKTKTT